MDRDLTSKEERVPEVDLGLAGEDVLGMFADADVLKDRSAELFLATTKKLRFC